MTELLALAALCEHGRWDRHLDADIYEAFGYQVKRAPTGRRGMSWRFFDQNERRWYAMARLTSSVDECSRFIEKHHPDWAWSVSNFGPSDEPHAVVTLNDDACTDVESSAIYPAIALAAALCRAEAAVRGEL